MRYATRSGNGFAWHKSKAAAVLAAKSLAREYGYAEVLRVRSLSMPPEVIATY